MTTTMDRPIKSRTLLLLVCTFLMTLPSIAQREETGIDSGWRFALGHAYDATRDFYNGTGAFSYFAKAGSGDGAAAPGYDDRAWRIVDLPHDWAVELPFDPNGSGSHGYRAIGRNFPAASVGWYRKSLFIPASDLGRRISIRFDGVFRDSKVWVNGFYLGNEQGGYNGFTYDITDYLNYGGGNSIAVRADVTMEEGWFYEGAGIYRHVWLTKTAAMHVADDGLSVHARVDGLQSDDKGHASATSAEITSGVSITNEGRVAQNFRILQTIIDTAAKPVATGGTDRLTLAPHETGQYATMLSLSHPQLWCLDDPYLYRLVTRILRGDSTVDSCVTGFGVRTIRFDPDSGFFLNGIHVKLRGTNDHQDHAGVGVAIPDALWNYRIRCLKGIGANAYRCSHNPPAPELLDACDRLGMLVIDENRWMGATPQLTDPLRRMILRDRNHPSVIAWSIGNEEWSIEGTPTGARVATTLQDYVHGLDSTRPVTAAVSGGWGAGISTVLQVMGFNYIAHGSTDEQHARFPWQAGMGTEEGMTNAARGVYIDDSAGHHLVAYDRKPYPGYYSIEEGWKYYAARPYLAGMFIWSGFDYRGEPTPFGWPSVSSYTGMLDACGFPKDDVWYLRSWWTDQPVLHVFPHWNWQGREGQQIPVWVYSNCREVELFLNGKSLGKRSMRDNSHLEWKIAYHPGVLEAIGYKDGKRVLKEVVHTSGEPRRVVLESGMALSGSKKGNVAEVDVKGHRCRRPSCSRRRQ